MGEWHKINLEEKKSHIFYNEIYNNNSQCNPKKYFPEMHANAKLSFGEPLNSLGNDKPGTEHKGIWHKGMINQRVQEISMQ